ncbi:MAG: YkgJ family cysteine cluster protein [Abditibacteriales bacterium]|nr:YkgJ family cysteine cluster protein [Abditibacteriales bacterium]
MTRFIRWRTTLMRLSVLPTYQNFTCHSCTHCCRTYIVTVTDEERARLLRQGWAEKLNLPADKLFQRVDVGGGREKWRLGHDASGACVFLAEDGLCRIHAEFGENAKPIECQIYPFTFVQTGNRVRVNLRFACPSVAGNRGKPISEQQRALERLAHRFLADAGKPSPPVLQRGITLTWEQTDAIAQAFIAAITDESLDLTARMLCASQLLEVLRHLPAADRVKDLNRYRERLAEGIKAEGYPRVQPKHGTRVMFRQLVGIYAKKEGSASGWHNFITALSFIAGKGELPQLQPHLPKARFEDLERPIGSLDDESFELLTRFYRVKLSSLAFCGDAHFGYTVIEGLGALLLTYPLILYFARWFAQERETPAERRVGGSLTLPAVSQAVQLIDTAYGYRRALALRAQRKRIELLTQEGALSRLIAWYGL